MSTFAESQRPNLAYMPDLGSEKDLGDDFQAQLRNYFMTSFKKYLKNSNLFKIATGELTDNLAQDSTNTLAQAYFY